MEQMCVVKFEKSGATKRFPYPVQLFKLAVDEPGEMQRAGTELVAARVNGLVLPLWEDIPAHRAVVSPVFADTHEGHSVLKRSLVFCLMVAVEREFGPCAGARDWFVTVEHSNGPSKTGYMVLRNGGDTRIAQADIDKLKASMTSITEKDLEIRRTKLSYEEAVEYFTEHGKLYSAKLVSAANEFAIACVACEGHIEVYRRPMVPRMGLLRNRFDLFAHDVGMVLSFPPPAGGAVARIPPDPAMTDVYREWNTWGKVLKCSCVGDVNSKIVDDPKSFIALCEAVHGERIVRASLDIQKRFADGARLILIAGPSSSGKTTFASKLGLQLEILGIKPLVLSVDNYYKCHADVPRDESGALDFEVLEALRVDLLNDHLLRLFEGEVVQSPIFDFHTGKPKTQTLRLQMPKGGVIIMEGIHCLNDRMTPRVPLNKKFKIFLAPLSQVNLDEGSFLSNSVTRLIRRIVRDYRSRGYSAIETLARWASVRRGEDANIFPFMQGADVVFNTALDYEINVLKTFCKPLLRSVKPGSPHYNLAQELLSFLTHFFPVPHDNVPPTSLLREFIGGSFFEAH